MPNKPVDIFMCAYLRPMFTEQTIVYLKERTKYPYRLFLIDNGGNEHIAKTYEKEIFMTITMSKNAGVTAAWQMALALAESDYFITTDNDIYVPDLQITDFPTKMDVSNYAVYQYGDWLERLVHLMDERPDYGAISLHPQVFMGAKPIELDDPEDVKERNMCGAVMRLMRRDAVRKVGGWADEGDMPLIRGDRGHEESTICSRLHTGGYKTGITTRIRAYHPFGKNWGYPEEIHPHEHGHRIPGEEIWPPPEYFDHIDSYDPKTWEPIK